MMNNSLNPDKESSGEFDVSPAVGGLVNVSDFDRFLKTRVGERVSLDKTIVQAID